MAEIHPSAVVSPKAEIESGVTIGPLCVVGDHVKLAAGVRLHSHCVVEGRTLVGEKTEIFPFASIGHQPQDLKFHGEPSELIIGRQNTIREHVTMNPGTEGGEMVTRVGDNCLFMVGTHVAHDCVIGDRVILANNATLAGHVVVEDDVIFGGMSAAHQFCRIGTGAFVGGMTGVEFDVIPFGSVIGNRAHLAGLNLVGLRRKGYPREQIHALRAAFKDLFAPGQTIKERVEDLSETFSHEPLVQQVVAFIRQASDRGLTMPLSGNNGS